MAERISVVVAHAQPLWHLGVEASLERQPDLAVVGEAATPAQARAVVGAVAPRVVLLALDLAGPGTEALVAELRRAHPTLAVLAAGAMEASARLAGLLAAGAVGYVLYDETPEGIASAVREVVSGRVWVSRRTPNAVAGCEARCWPHLSVGQQQVLALLARGWSNAQIAAELRLSERTVRHHVAALRASLGLATRGEVIAWAGRQALQPAEGPLYT